MKVFTPSIVFTLSITVGLKISFKKTTVLEVQQNLYCIQFICVVQIYWVFKKISTLSHSSSLSLSLSIYIYIYIYIYISFSSCLHAYIHIPYTCIHIYTSTPNRHNTNTQPYMCASVCVCACVCVCVRVCECVCDRSHRACMWNRKMICGVWQ